MSGTAWERYMHPGLADVWYTPEGVGQFLYVHQVTCVVAEVQEGMSMIKRGTAAALKRVEVDLERIIQIQQEGENHQLRAYLRMVQEQMRANGDEEFLPGVHFLLTSFDLQDTATSLMLVKSADLLLEDAEKLCQALRHRAAEHKNTLMIGRTHGIHGTPITFGKKCLDWLDLITRARYRLREQQKKAGVGKISGAMGVYNQDPHVELLVCRKLGLEPAQISTQIIPRDYYAEFFSAVVLLMTGLEHIATSIRTLQRTEIGEVEEPFATTGSSAMPHKRNPERCEQICGLARVVRNMMGILYEDVVTWDERSLEQSSAERLTFSSLLVLTGYGVFSLTKIVSGMTVYPERMVANLQMTHGAICAEDVKNELQRVGVDQNTAYDLVKGPAQRAYRGEGEFIDLAREDPEIAHRFTRQELVDLCDPKRKLVHIPTIFSRFGL